MYTASFARKISTLLSCYKGVEEVRSEGALSK